MIYTRSQADAGSARKRQPDGLHVEVDERLARVELRRQIGRLERELAGLFAEAFGRVEVAHRVAALAGEPRVLDLGELERLRDELAERVAEARLALRERARVETAQPRAAASRCSPPRRTSSGSRSPAPTSACRAAATGTRARASARSGC